MNDNEYKKMSMYKQGLGNIDENKKRPLTFYEKYLKKERKETTEKEPKTAIWWMIMIFCLVYGFEYVYTAMISMQ